ncbi:Sulfite reductase [NADPH] hemoprotein beta-component [Pigmentiphaga humi]|uniref:Sulfite reductase [NADPH] hemoprotein beta-component n=1 Tax=Pigmentiphaga humi TaxID=2478468 RepID=A0A3P4B6X9_9BURK|nr:assimilatory sulfite reductase (NADPH) hemoprotein subunit [Pigmentiphaga humi]VCU71681.1 Sulfite reductase [NADPH] hemoprotein beta-component [Pigmentiphaga humi]
MKPRTTIPIVPDRSRDISQPLEKLSADERLKAGSDQLRGTIAESLMDRITGAVAESDAKLMKFHGIYQQDDRDLRAERRHQKLEPAYQFMVRVRMPGGVCTAAQWLKLDELARAHGGDSLRITTRGTIQFHWILKHALRSTLQGLHEVLLDTIAACGDDARGVVCSVNPGLSGLHRQVHALARQASDHVIPRMRAYHEIWYGEARIAGSEPEEPFYGNTYLPRKFKIGFVIPPCNDIDVYAQDLGFIAIVKDGKLLGFNVAIGGGMGNTDRDATTWPRLADVIGFAAPEQVIAVCDAVMGVQRDHGDRKNRAHARFKYTIDDHGLDWIKAEIERRLGYALKPPRRYAFTTNGDAPGWQRDEEGRWHVTLLIPAGRVTNSADAPWLDGLRAIARVHRGTLRLTTNQNLVISGIEPDDRPAIERLLESHGLLKWQKAGALRRSAIACVALPTCGLAMAESERYLPALLDRLEPLLDRYGLAQAPITLRISGCPNGCSRPYIAEIALTGRAIGRYNLYLGGGFHGERLARLYLENAPEDSIVAALDEVLGHYAADRQPDEHLGDFVVRAGYVTPVRDGPDFNTPNERRAERADLESVPAG